MSEFCQVDQLDSVAAPLVLCPLTSKRAFGRHKQNNNHHFSRSRSHKFKCCRVIHFKCRIALQASLVATCCLVLLIATNGARSQQVAPTTSGHDNLTHHLTTQTNTRASEEIRIDPTEAPQNVSSNFKLKPVNFTLVDELFSATLSELDTLKRWKNMDAQFQEGIRSILKLVFPQIVAISQDAKVSGDCSGGILKWILSLRNLRSWAIKMLDATGKPSAGIFEGSLTMFGNYRQCLSVRAPDEDEIEITDQFEEYFRGQFCVLHMRPWLAHKRPFYNLNTSVDLLVRQNYKYYEKTLYDELAEIAIAFNFIDIRLDLCVPSTCSMGDIQRVADLLGKKLEMRAKVMRCDIESRSSTSLLVKQMLDQTTLFWSLVPLGLVALTLVATCCRAFCGPFTRYARVDQILFHLSLAGATKSLLNCTQASRTPKPFKAQDTNNNNNNNRVDEQTSTSLWSHGRNVLKRPVPLYGVRNILLVWFIIVQLTVELKYQFLRESLVLRNMLLAYWPLQIIVNTSMIYDSLILITAFTFSYTNLTSSTRELCLYIVQKIVRLVPSIATLVLVTIVMSSLEIASPVWKNFVDLQSSVCKSNGYLNLFFLQNFISYDKICLPHTWLFCVELQLIALAMPLLLLLKKTFVNNEDALISSGSNHSLNKTTFNKCCAQQTIGTQLKLSLAYLFKSSAGFIGLALILIGIVINFVLVYTNKLPPAWFHTFPDAEQKSYYFGSYFTKTWTHLTTFVIGMYAGFLCRATIELTARGTDSSVKGRSDKGSVASENKIGIHLQVGSLACLMALIFCTFSWSTGELPNELVSALYDSLARLAWALALSIVMIRMCLPANVRHEENKESRRSGGEKFAPYSSFSQRMFSHPISMVLGRLSFLAYLLAPVVHTLVLALQEQALFPSLYLIFHIILGNIVITYLLAFVLSILIERPIWLAFCQLCCNGAGWFINATRSMVEESGCEEAGATSVRANKQQDNEQDEDDDDANKSRQTITTMHSTSVASLAG